LCLITTIRWNFALETRLHILGEAMNDLLRDLRYGIRMVVKNPGFTLIVVLTLALGIGANTAIFSVVNAVLLRPLPFQDADRLFRVYETNRERRGGVTAPNFTDWRAQQTKFEQIAASFGRNYNLTSGGEPERLSGARVSANYFALVGVQPVIGRSFSPAEDQHGANRVAILSHGLWQRRFGGNEGIIGQTITLDREQHVIIGVMPPTLRLQANSAQIWIPLALSPGELSANGSHFLQVIGRLKPEATRETAEAEMKTIAKQLESKRPHSNTGWSVALVPIREQLVGDVQQSLLILLGAVGFVLLIACANVASLMLARASAREKEMSIRLALGASAWRLSRQLLTESLVLAFLGGVLGLLLAIWGADVLVTLLPDYIPRLGETGIDGTVLGFTFGMALLTGLLFGLAPAFQASKPDPNKVLKEGGRSAMAGLGPYRLRSALVVGEVAMALLLLVGAGLLIRSFWRLQAVAPGFNPENVATLQMALPESRYPQPGQMAAFYQAVLERLSALPEVQSAAFTSHLPLGSGGFNLALTIEGHPPTSPQQLPTAFYRAVSADYFRAMGIPQVAGRAFTDLDREGTTRVAVINQQMAQRFWPGENPLGKRFTADDNETTPIEIVGIVGDVKHFGLGNESGPEFFVPYQQARATFWRWASRSLTLVIRPRTESAIALAGVRQAIWAVDSELPLYRVTSLEQLLSDSIAMQRVYMTLLVGFALIALLLAVVGIYGVMSYLVTQRTHEIGIRMALGAHPRDVLKLMINQGMRLTMIGIAIGLLSAFALTRFMSNLLFSIGPTDPVTFLLIAILLGAVALLACWIPAGRATKVDPMIALRFE
jgi:putative ABC transport system permease protein